MAGGEGETDGGDEDLVDGRMARRARNADAVVDATIALMTEGVVAPTAIQIAERAGVSLRSVFRYYTSLDALTAEAATVYVARNAARLVYSPPSHDDRTVEERIADVTRHYADLYEHTGPLARAAVARAAFDPAFAEVVGRTRTATIAALEALFAPELAAMPAEQRPLATAEAHSAVTFETWDNLVDRHGLTVDEASEMARTRLAAALRRHP